MKEKINLDVETARTLIWSSEPEGGFKKIDRIFGTNDRWSVWVLLVIERISDGKLFGSYYQKGLTEYQEMDAWDGDDVAEFIEATPYVFSETRYSID